jgi:hypothetical protein
MRTDGLLPQSSPDGFNRVIDRRRRFAAGG